MSTKTSAFLTRYRLPEAPVPAEDDLCRFMGLAFMLVPFTFESEPIVPPLLVPALPMVPDVAPGGLPPGATLPALLVFAPGGLLLGDPLPPPPCA